MKVVGRSPRELKLGVRLHFDYDAKVSCPRWPSWGLGGQGNYWYTSRRAGPRRSPAVWLLRLLSMLLRPFGSLQTVTPLSLRFVCVCVSARYAP